MAFKVENDEFNYRKSITVNFPHDFKESTFNVIIDSTISKEDWNKIQLAESMQALKSYDYKSYISIPRKDRAEIEYCYFSNGIWADFWRSAPEEEKDILFANGDGNVIYKSDLEDGYDKDMTKATWWITMPVNDGSSVYIYW